MAITRKFLRELGLDSEQESAVISEYLDAVAGHKETISDLREKVRALDGVKQELSERTDAYNALSQEKAEADAKVTALVSETETLKQELAGSEKKFTELEESVANEKTTNAKISALKSLLEKDAQVGGDYLTTVLNATDLSTIEIDDDGKITNSDAIVTGVKEKYPKFIDATVVQPAPVSTPPANNNGETVSVEQFKKMGYAARNELYRNNPDEYRRLQNGGANPDE